MTISEIINKYNALKNDADREALIIDRIVRQYVSIQNKKDICEQIIKHSITGNNIDMISKYVMYFLALIYSHTDIDIDYTGNNIYSDYDRLRECGVLQHILSMLAEDEISEFNIIMDSLCDIA